MLPFVGIRACASSRTFIGRLLAPSAFTNNIPRQWVAKSLTSTTIRPGKASIPDFEGQPSQPGVNSPRLDKITRKFPKYLRPWTSEFVKAPGSHVTAFLILHELSAVLPLFGFWWLFHHYPLLMPLDLPTTVIEKGTQVIETSLANYDLFQYNIADKTRYVVEGAYAYAVTKALFPLRVIFSLAAMPLFARVFIAPWARLFLRVFGAKRKKDSVVQDADAVTKKKVTKPRL